MYQTFNDAHFVDSALCGGTPESWESTRENAVTDTVKITYISQNGAIWGVPLDYSDYTTLTLDADDAVDVGGGIVGLPCASHPFKISDVIWVEGTTHYEMSHTLTAGTTATELQFADTFNAETFDGTETVVQYISLGAGAGRMDIDKDGNMYFGTVNIGGSGCLTKISVDGTIETDFFTPDTPFGNIKTCIGLKVSINSEYLYVFTDSTRLRKFDLSDGSEVWSVLTDESFPTFGYNLDIDEDDNVYVCNTGTYPDHWRDLAKYSAADGTKTEFTYMGKSKSASIVGGAGVYDVRVDNDMGKVIVGGYQVGLTAVKDLLYNLAIRDLDNSSGAQIALGGTYESSPGIYTTYIVGTGHITTYNDYIYVLCKNTDGDLVVHKLDTDLNSIATIATGDMPSYPTGLFVDTEGQIVVVNQDWTNHQSDIFYFYDTDLNYLDKTDGFYTLMLTAWAAAVGGAWSQGNVKFFYNVAPHGINTTYVTQKRNLWFPSDYCHLKGETVKKFVDGVILDDEVVPESCEVVGDDGDAVHIGLAFTYKLKPMRLVFSARKGTNLGSIKHLNEMVVNFLDTLNAKYGKDTDSLYDIMWASASEFFSGDYTVALDSGFGKDDDVLISGDDPVPCTVRAMIPRVDVTGR